MNEHLTVVITKDQVQGYGQTNSETKPRSTLSAVSGSKLDAIDFTIFEVFFGDSCFIKNVRDRRTWLKKERRKRMCKRNGSWLSYSERIMMRSINFQHFFI
ncbi:hypothetical protein NC652_021248 [Populus alba x Populus x berolinensis]|nr:hypothetical protein NC652_021246 [Populus alba x Populus x berolinensis]KAJ6910520.1 hypothetical protein NC652_021248 [Populus alba x Populus x berolinensis]